MILNPSKLWQYLICCGGRPFTNDGMKAIRGRKRYASRQAGKSEDEGYRHYDEEILLVDMHSWTGSEVMQ